MKKSDTRIGYDFGLDPDKRRYHLSYVQAWAANKEQVYLAHVGGKIFAFDQRWGKKCRLLGEHYPHVDFLACEGDVLVSGSKGRDSSDNIAKSRSSCIFWDLKTCKKIAKITTENLQAMRFINNQLWTLQGEKCVKYDFLIPYKEKSKLIPRPKNESIPKNEEKKSTCLVA